jgi:hypothetical protein
MRRSRGLGRDSERRHFAPRELDFARGLCGAVKGMKANVKLVNHPNSGEAIRRWFQILTNL